MLVSIVTANADGSITLKLAATQEIVLPEPSAAQYAAIFDVILKADEKLPPAMRLSSDQPSVDELVAASDRLTQRRTAQFSPQDPAYAQAWIEIVFLLTGRTLELEELHRNALIQEPLRDLRGVWEAPLDGPASNNGTTPIASPVPVPLQDDPETSSLSSDVPAEDGSHSGTDDSSPSLPESSTT